MFDVSKYSVSNAEKYNSFCTLKFGPHFGVGTRRMRVGSKDILSVILGGVYKGSLSLKGRREG